MALRQSVFMSLCDFDFLVTIFSQRLGYGLELVRLGYVRLTNKNIPVRMWSVSYTHLDVYKRQGQEDIQENLTDEITGGHGTICRI